MAESYGDGLVKTEKLINDYFECCDSLNESDGKKIIKPYTLSGLLCYAGLTRRQFEKLMGKKRYAEIFNRALSRIEAFTEEKALIGALSASAASNTLKYNFGWNDSAGSDDKNASCGIIKLVLDGELMKLAE